MDYLDFDKIFSNLNWENIIEYYSSLNIYWSFQKEDGGVGNRIPNINDLKSELKSLIIYMINNDLDDLSYGNWIIYNHTIMYDLSYTDIRIIFSIDECTYNEDIEDGEIVFHKEFEIDYLQSQLEVALKQENYEFAAILRDKINKYKKDE